MKPVEVHPSASGRFLLSCTTLHAGPVTCSTWNSWDMEATRGESWDCLEEEQSRLLEVRAEGFLDMTSV